MTRSGSTFGSREGSGTLGLQVDAVACTLVQPGGNTPLRSVLVRHEKTTRRQEAVGRFQSRRMGARALGRRSVDAGICAGVHPRVHGDIIVATSEERERARKHCDRVFHSPAFVAGVIPAASAFGPASSLGGDRSSTRKFVQSVESYGVTVRMGVAARTTFLIDSDGVIRRVFENVDAGVHIDEVLAAISEL